MARPRRDEQIIAGRELPECDEQVVHIDAVLAARNALPDTADLTGMTEIFGALSDPTRLRIVAALAAGELCVCDLAATVGMSQSAVSHQLRVLRDRGLVRSRKEGRRAYYSLNDEHVSSLYQQAHEHARHLEGATA